MQPRNIQVFDGLRITTDHIDHLQGSIHSAIGDVRDILGLGRVHRGCAVIALDAGAIQVGPGLAFDRQRRRIVIDEPARIAVSPMAAGDVRYVCLSYDEVADGEVQGQPTRVWDSGLVEVRPSPPSVTEDVIVLARLMPAGDAGFEVRPPFEEIVPETVPPPIAAADGTMPASTETPTPASPPSSPHLPSAVLAVSPIDVAGLDAIVGPKLASAVRARLAAPDTTPVFRERVATIEAHAGVTITVLATHGTLTLECVSAAETPIPVADTANVAPTNTRWRAESAMQGHVVFGQADPTQCAAGTSIIGDWSSGASHVAPVMSVGDVLRCAFGGNATAESPSAEQFVHGLAASVCIVPRNGDGFGADVWLEWNGDVTEALAKWLESAPPQVSCRGTLGWVATAAAVAGQGAGG